MDEQRNASDGGASNVKMAVIYAVLQEAETQLRTSLRKEFASPFIAHHAVARPDEVRRAVIWMVDGEFRGVRRLFQNVSAVALWAIAEALASNYAGEGDNACYPHIEAALGLKCAMDQSERTALRRMFRSAANRLLLSLPPEEGGSFAGFTWQAMDDFFAQAGISLHQAEQLALMFRRGQGSFGVPEADSTESLRRWEIEVVERHTPQGLRRPPKVLLSDTTGYHAGLFARIEAQGEPDTPFARRFRDSLKKEPAPEGQFVARLVCMDGQLQLRDGHRASEFDADFEGRTELVRRVRTLPLPLPWPRRVTCWASGEKPSRQSLAILPESDVALVFDAGSGRLDRTLKRSDTVAAIRRGEVAIVSRYPFTVDDKVSFEAARDAHVRYLELKRAATLIVDGHQITLRPQARAALRVPDGRIVARDGDIPFLAGLQSVLVEYPGASELAANDRLELELRHAAIPGGQCYISCPEPDDSDTMMVPLDGMLPQAGAFGLLQIELRQKGSDRRLARERFWLWPGLTSFPNGGLFVAPNIPPNWDERRSEHVRRNEEGQLQLDAPEDSPYEYARLVLSDAGDANGTEEPLAVFHLPPPGVSLLLREADGNKRPLRLGQRLALSPRDGSTLQIRTPDYDATLDIKGAVEQESFRNGLRELTANRLANTVAMTAGHSEIRYRGGDGAANWQTLLHLVDVEEALEFTVSETAEDSTVAVALGRLPLAVRVRVDGVTLRASEEYDEAHPALLVLRLDATQSLEVTIRKRRLSGPGLYMAQLEIAFEPGRWLQLTNDRRDRYDWALSYDAPVRAIPEAQADDLLVRLTEILGRCAARECWQGSLENHLVPRWKLALTTMQRRMPTDLGPLLAAAHTSWDNERASTWVPMRHPIEHVPNLYGAPPGAFRFIRVEDSAPGAERLREIARFRKCTTVLDVLEQLDIEVRALGCFANMAALSGGAETVPRDFSFERFLHALAAVPARERGSLWTPRQKRLTMEHHSWCCGEFDNRLRKVHLPKHNQMRVEWLIKLARAATDLRHLPGLIALKYGALTVPDQSDSLDHTADRSLVQNVPWLMSALVRYSVAHSQSDLEKMLADTAALDLATVRETLGFATRLAPELLAFYLMVWHLASFNPTNDARTESA